MIRMQIQSQSTEIQWEDMSSGFTDRVLNV